MPKAKAKHYRHMRAHAHRQRHRQRHTPRAGNRQQATDNGQNNLYLLSDTTTYTCFFHTHLRQATYLPQYDKTATATNKKENKQENMAQNLLLEYS